VQSGYKLKKEEGEGGRFITLHPSLPVRGRKEEKGERRQAQNTIVIFLKQMLRGRKGAGALPTGL